MLRSSFPRRQQYRRLRRAGASGVTAIAAGTLTVVAVGAGAPALAGAFVLIVLGLVIDTRRWLRLAGRSRVGARSEDAVRAALAALQQRAGNFAIRCAIAGTAISTASQSHPPGSRSRSNPRPEPSTSTTSPTPARWRHGFAATASAGAPPALSRSYA